jgi:hypothetical protein
MNNESEETWKGAVISYLRHYGADRLEVIRTAKKNVVQYRRGSDNGSKMYHLNTSQTLELA